MNDSKSSFLELSFNIAQKYFTIAQTSKGEDEQKFELFELARRYFSVCAHFNYSPGYPEYFLGIIDTELKDYGSAVNQFLAAKEKIGQEQVDDNDLISGVDFYLGSSLINQGQQDAGILYLKTLYNSMSTNESWKNYADMYFKALANELFSVSFSGGLQYHQNIHQLNNTDRQSMPLLKSEYGKVPGAYRNLCASAYYYSGMGAKWSTTFIINGINLTAVDREQKNRDFTSVGSYLLLQANHSESTVPGITFSYSRSFYRPFKDAETQNYQTIIEMNPQFNYLTKKGISTFKLQLSQTRDIYADQLYKVGPSFNYVPLFKKKWLAPSFTLASSYKEESIPYDPSMSFSATLTNHAALGRLGDLFLTAVFTKNTNDAAYYDYVEHTYELLWSKAIRLLRGVVFSFSVSDYRRQDELPTTIEDQTAEAKLSFSF